MLPQNHTMPSRPPPSTTPTTVEGKKILADFLKKILPPTILFALFVIGLVIYCKRTKHAHDLNAGRSGSEAEADSGGGIDGESGTREDIDARTSDH